MSARREHWEAVYRRPADDIRELQAMLADGDMDFTEFEMSDR